MEEKDAIATICSILAEQEKVTVSDSPSYRQHLLNTAPYAQPVLTKNGSPAVTGRSLSKDGSYGSSSFDFSSMRKEILETVRREAIDTGANYLFVEIDVSSRAYKSSYSSASHADLFARTTPFQIITDREVEDLEEVYAGLAIPKEVAEACDRLELVVDPMSGLQRMFKQDHEAAIARVQEMPVEQLVAFLEVAPETLAEQVAQHAKDQYEAAQRTILTADLFAPEGEDHE